MDNKMYQACLPEDFWKMTLEDCYAKNYLDAYSILARGFWCCENKPKEGKLLLTGIIHLIIELETNQLHLLLN